MEELFLPNTVLIEGCLTGVRSPQLWNMQFSELDLVTKRDASIEF